MACMLSDGYEKPLLEFPRTFVFGSDLEAGPGTAVQEHNGQTLPCWPTWIRSRHVSLLFLLPLRTMARLNVARLDLWFRLQTPPMAPADAPL